MKKNECTITSETAAIIKGMVLRGDKQMHVAVWAGCNQARVSEIANGRGWGRRFLNVAPASPDRLPEPGPYVIISQRRVTELELREAVVSQLEKLVASLRAGSI